MKRLTVTHQTFARLAVRAGSAPRAGSHEQQKGGL